MRQTIINIPDGYELRSYDDEQAAPFLIERHTVVDGIEKHEVTVRGVPTTWVASRWAGGREAA